MLNYPVLQVVGGAGDTEHISNRPNLQEGGWGGWVALSRSALHRLSNPEPGGGGHRPTTGVPGHLSRRFGQNVQLEVKDSFFDVVTLIQQIKVAEQQVIIAREALHARKSTIQAWLEFDRVRSHRARWRSPPRETRLAETQYDAKISEARLRYAIGGTLGVRSDGGVVKDAGFAWSTEVFWYGRAGDRERRQQSVASWAAGGRCHQARGWV